MKYKLAEGVLLWEIIPLLFFVCQQMHYEVVLRILIFRKWFRPRNFQQHPLYKLEFLCMKRLDDF